MQTFTIPELKIGQFSLYNVSGVVMQKLWGGNDESFKHTQASKSGVIGLKLLSHYGVLLDYAHSRAISTEGIPTPTVII